MALEACDYGEILPLLKATKKLEKWIGQYCSFG